MRPADGPAGTAIRDAIGLVSGVQILSDIIGRLDELIIAVVAASSGGFIGGWMALRAAKASIDRTVQASREERQAAAVAHRRQALVALEAELRLNAALLDSEQPGRQKVAPAWRIPFRDAYVTALPYLSSLPPGLQATLQQAAILSSHYVHLAQSHQRRAFSHDRESEAGQVEHHNLSEMAPGVSDHYLRAADELSAYLRASAPVTSASGAPAPDAPAPGAAVETAAPVAASTP